MVKISLTDFPNNIQRNFHYQGNCGVISEKVKEVLLYAGYGKINPKVPLSDIIQPGMSVLLKPNWVNHRNLSNGGMECMITQPEFILAVLQEVINAQPGKIIIGDAPIQGCHFNELYSDKFLQSIKSIAQNVNVDIIDFRLNSLVQTNEPYLIKNQSRNYDDYILFDLKEDSLLEPVSSPAGRFRVTMYDPKEMAKTQNTGVHQYLLSKEAFSSDVIINLPKLKTHRKTGITAALKNVIGLNGSKDYLPHHRAGGSFSNGDCYFGWSLIKSIAEKSLDNANRSIGTSEYRKWIGCYSRIMSIYNRFGNPEIEGSWYGNDTIWRTVLDINRILLYGNLDGTMSEEPKRTVLSITDAIISGEGNGPLEPFPYNRGIITCSNNSLAVDVFHAILLGFDPNRISMIQHGFSKFRWPLHHDYLLDDLLINYNGKKLDISQFTERFAGHSIPPKGWKDHCEIRNGINS